MASMAKTDEDRAVDVWFDGDLLVVALQDGRRISTPVAWYPRLRTASPDQRANWEIDGVGWGIHWPDVDEDLSVQGMLAGRPASGWQQTDAPLR